VGSAGGGGGGGGGGGARATGVKRQVMFAVTILTQLR